MAIQESGEMYLESIFVLSKKNKTVLSIDVCEYMGYSKPSVSRAVKILKEQGYIVMEDGGNLRLTEKGREIGLISEERYNEFLLKKSLIEEETK